MNFNFGNYLKSISQNIGKNVKKGVDYASNAVASIPYKLSDASINYQKIVKTPFNENKYNQSEQRNENIINSKPPEQQQMMADSIYRYQPQNPDSANTDFMSKTYTTAPKTNPFLETLKQQILNSQRLRQPAKDYLSKIPVTYSDNPAGMNTSWGASNAKGEPGRYIDISSKHLGGQDEETKQKIATVLKHEMLHQSPRFIPTNLYNEQDKNKVNTFTNRWGKDYMKRKGAMTEELFAEQQLPKPYYWHLFNK